MVLLKIPKSLSNYKLGKKIVVAYDLPLQIHISQPLIDLVAVQCHPEKSGPCNLLKKIYRTYWYLFQLIKFNMSCDLGI